MTYSGDKKFHYDLRCVSALPLLGLTLSSPWLGLRPCSLLPPPPFHIIAFVYIILKRKVTSLLILFVHLHGLTAVQRINKQSKGGSRQIS